MEWNEKTETRIRQAKISYNYCRVCGSTPNSNDEPNYAPLRYWDCDDGWIIGTLCHYCAREVLPAKPKPTDYAFKSTNQVCDIEDTDEDILDAL